MLANGNSRSLAIEHILTNDGLYIYIPFELMLFLHPSETDRLSFISFGQYDPIDCKQILLILPSVRFRS